MARKSRIFKPTIAEPILDAAGHPMSIELPTPDDLIALRLANAALRKLRLCGASSKWYELSQCDWGTEDDLRLLVLTELPIIPLAVGASILRNYSRQNTRWHTNSVMIAAGNSTVLHLGWGLEGSFYIDEFNRGEDWEARVLAFEQLAQTTPVVAPAK